MYGSDWGPLSSALNGLDLNGHGGGRWQFNDGEDGYSDSEVSSIGTMGELGDDARLGEDRERESEEEDDDDGEGGGGAGDDEDFSRGETEGKDEEEDGKVDENTNNWEVSRLVLFFPFDSKSRRVFSVSLTLSSLSSSSLSLSLSSPFFPLLPLLPCSITAHVPNNAPSHASLANRSPTSFLLRWFPSSTRHARERSRWSSVGRDGSRGRGGDGSCTEGSWWDGRRRSR